MSVKLTPIQELEAALRENPSQAGLYLDLARQYLEKGRDIDAEQLAAKGAAACSDLRVRDLRDDLKLARLRRNVELAARHVDENETPDTRAALARAEAERNEIELAVMEERAKRDPDSLPLRVQLAARLREAGRVHEAVRMLQAALDDPESGATAALQLGECYRRMERAPEALARYRQAVRSSVLPEQDEIKREALWRAAGLAEKIKLERLASRYRAELALITPAYVPPGRFD